MLGLAAQMGRWAPMRAERFGARLPRHQEQGLRRTLASEKGQREGNMHSENRFTTMNRRDFLRLGGAGLAGATLLGTAGGRVLAQTDSSLKAKFETAARKYKVPVELLLAMGYYNTLWEMPPPSASAYRKGDPEGRGDYGIMQLTQNPSRNTLGQGREANWSLQSSTQERSHCQHRGRRGLPVRPGR